MKSSTRSLQRQVTVAVFAAIASSLVLAAIGLAVFEYQAAAARLHDTLEPVTEITLTNVASAVDFDVPEAARESLFNLQASSSIRHARLWSFGPDLEPRLFAEFQRPGTPDRFGAEPRETGYYVNGDGALIVKTLERDGHPIARLQVEGDLASARRSLGETLSALGVIFALLIVVGAALSHLLQRAITRRIRALAKLAETVRNTEDYGLRATETPADEIGQLAHRFNDVLAGIQERDRRLAESHVFQSAILGSTSVAVFTTDSAGVVRTLNPAAELMIGYTAREVIGRFTPQAWHLPEEIEVRAERFSRETGRPITAGFDVFIHEARSANPQGREWTFVHRSGRHIPVLLQVSELRRQDGELIGYCGLATDLTERRRARVALDESEARFRRLTENAPDVIFRYRVEADGIRCEFINAAIERLSGYSPEDFYQNRLLPLRIVDPRDRPVIASLIDRRVIPSRAAEIRWVTKDGRVVTTEQRFVPVYDANENLIAFEGIARDITEIKQEEKRSRQLQLQLHHAQKMQSIGTLAGGIAHDFNNILTGILGFTEIARLSLDDDHPAVESLDEVRLAGRRARDLVAQILTFSRPQDAQRVPLDLARSATETLKLLRASAPASVKIERHFETGPVSANPTQIHQVVLNLCTNAVHAIGDQPGVLRVEVKRVEVDADLALRMPKLAPGRCVRLSVIDTGRGMDPATIGRVFDPFFTTKKSGEGTGIGLSVVQGIVTSHQGGILVESTPGQGSTFSVYLPAIDYLSEDHVTVTPPLPGRNERILVVDDEKSIGEFIGVRLEHYQYRVAVFDDPRHALAAARTTTTGFEAIVTDFTMPELNGLELIRAIRADGRFLPAVIVTGNRDSLSESDLPALAVVDKPFTGEDIARALRRLLDETPPPS